MKNVLVVLVLIFLLGCGENKNEKAVSASNSVAISTEEDDSTKTKIVLKDSVRIDPDIKKKFVEAFALIKKYQRETKVNREQIQSLIGRYTRIISGTEVQNGELIDIKYETAPVQGDLVVFLEDKPQQLLEGHVAQTVYFKDRHQSVMSITTEFVKTKSVALVAGVILHEMVHAHLYDCNYLQEEDSKKRNEYSAYLTEVYFLVWVYNGPDIELDCFNGVHQNISVHPEDMSEYKYYMNQISLLR